MRAHTKPGARFDQHKQKKKPPPGLRLRGSRRLETYIFYRFCSPPLGASKPSVPPPF